MRNVDSARVSVPGQLRKQEPEEGGDGAYHWRTDLAPTEPYWKGELRMGCRLCWLQWAPRPLASHHRCAVRLVFVWLWAGWFENMSSLFLSVPGPKMLVLAGTDRLDTPLTIGQMQGKYQLALMPHCGHQIHEDVSCPPNTAPASFFLVLPARCRHSMLACDWHQ